MAASGIQVPQSVRDEFNNMKLKKSFQFMIISVEDGKGIVSKTGKAGASYAEFKKALRKDEACFGIFDNKGKLVFIHWNPDSASVKSRMITSTTAQAVRDACAGLGATYQCDNYESLDAACL